MTLNEQLPTVHHLEIEKVVLQAELQETQKVLVSKLNKLPVGSVHVVSEESKIPASNARSKVKYTKKQTI